MGLTMSQRRAVTKAIATRYKRGVPMASIDGLAQYLDAVDFPTDRDILVPAADDVAKTLRAMPPVSSGLLTVGSESVGYERSQNVSDRLWGLELATSESTQQGLKFAAETPRRQFDLVFDGAGLAMGGTDVGADVSQQSDHGRIVGRGQRGEAADAFLAGAVSELTEQLGPESPALPVVDDSDGNFGSLWVSRVSHFWGVESRVAGDVGIVGAPSGLVWLE